MDQSGIPNLIFTSLYTYKDFGYFKQLGKVLFYHWARLAINPTLLIRVSTSIAYMYRNQTPYLDLIRHSKHIVILNKQYALHRRDYKATLLKYAIPDGCGVRI